MLLEHLLSLIPQPIKPVPAGIGKADLVREPPRASKLRDEQTDTGAQALSSFGSFPVLPSNSPPPLAKERGREGPGPWVQGSAATRLAVTALPYEVQVRRGLLPCGHYFRQILLQQHLKEKGSPLEHQRRWGFPEPAALARHGRSCCFSGSLLGNGGCSGLPSCHQPSSALGFSSHQQQSLTFCSCHSCPILATQAPEKPTTANTSPRELFH